MSHFRLREVKTIFRRTQMLMESSSAREDRVDRVEDCGSDVRMQRQKDLAVSRLQYLRGAANADGVILCA
jgi:hypothetical protein